MGQGHPAAQPPPGEDCFTLYTTSSYIVLYYFHDGKWPMQLPPVASQLSFKKTGWCRRQLMVSSPCLK